MTTTILFGWSHDNLDAVAAAIQSASGISLERRDSHHLGLYYKSTLSGSRSIQLCHNADPLFDEQSDPPEDRFSEPDFPAVRLLLYVHNIDLSHACQMFAGIDGISFLTERKGN